MARIDPQDFMTRNGQPVTLRCAEPRESRQIARLMERSYSESPYLATRVEEFVVSPRRIAAWIESHLSSPGKLMLVAEHRGGLIGMIDFSSSSKLRMRHVGEFGLSVNREWQRRGIGRALLEALIAWARTSAVIEKIELQVFSGNRPAIQLYESLGFREEGRRLEAIRLMGSEGAMPDYMDLLLMGLFVREKRF